MNPKKAPILHRHIPQRTCISCRQVRLKRELIRLVSSADGTLQIDETGKMSGRGAYLCPRRECWDAGLKNKLLERAFRKQIDPEAYARLLDYAEERWATGNQEGAE